MVFKKWVFMFMVLMGFSGTLWAQNFSSLKCGEIRSVSDNMNCQNVDQFIKSAFATCLDYNLATKMWSKDQSARAQGDSSFFNEYMNSKKALRNQLIVTMNQLTELLKKPDCQRLLKNVDVSKALEAIKASAQMTEMVFPRLNFEKLTPQKDCDPS